MSNLILDFVPFYFYLPITNLDSVARERCGTLGGNSVQAEPGFFTLSILFILTRTNLDSVARERCRTLGGNSVQSETGFSFHFISTYPLPI